MKRIINTLGILIALSLIMVTSLASAEVKFTNKDLISNPQEGQILQSTGKNLDYSGGFYRSWYDFALERLFHLRVDNIFIGRFNISIDNKLEVSTPTSETMTTRITFGNPGITLLPDTGRYNLGLGVSTRLHNGLSIDSSVSFAFSGSPDVILWITLRPIHF